MIAKIQIPDGLPLNKILKGSLYLTANAEGAFRAYNIGSKKLLKKHFKRLSHGRLSWTKDEVRLSIHIDRKEDGVNPVVVICQDATDASKVNLSTEED